LVGLHFRPDAGTPRDEGLQSRFSFGSRPSFSPSYIFLTAFSLNATGPLSSFPLEDEAPSNFSSIFLVGYLPPFPPPVLLRRAAFALLVSGVRADIVQLSLTF